MPVMPQPQLTAKTFLARPESHLQVFPDLQSGVAA
jgi:hypothetical protein